jgi:hypothetical protein
MKRQKRLALIFSNLQDLTNQDLVKSQIIQNKSTVMAVTEINVLNLIAAYSSLILKKQRKRCQNYEIKKFLLDLHVNNRQKNKFGSV